MKKDQFLDFAASGFKDFTRIASGDPDMWCDVCLCNRDSLLEEINKYTDELQTLKEKIETSDSTKLRDYFDKARTLRNEWLLKKGL